MSLITFITRIHFADRVLEDALSEELERLGIRCPLVISTAQQAGCEEEERLEDALPRGTRAHWVRIAPEGAGDHDLTTARALCTEAGCDGIIGLGEAAALDLARLLGQGGKPVVSVPTSAGGVGLGPLGIGLARHAGPKPPIPAAILCDATLTLRGDPASSAAAGMDTLIHCLEAFLSSSFNPPADGIALDGLRRAAAFLPRVVRDGQDIDARREMLAAALNGGLAAQKGLGGVEAAARGIEQVARVRHGMLHGALLPAVLAFNAPAVTDRIAMIRTVLGLGPQGDAIAALSRLAEEAGLPGRLSVAGVAPDLVRRAASRAAADLANRTNPRHATPLDYEAMISAAL